MSNIQYISILNLSDEQKLQHGLDERIFSLIEINGGAVQNLYLLTNDLVRPIAYFDSSNGFEFRFTTFLGGWEDVSQIQRFGRQLKLHNNSIQ